MLYTNKQTINEITNPKETNITYTQCED